jgi:hypothetical protein
MFSVLSVTESCFLFLDFIGMASLFS